MSREPSLGRIHLEELEDNSTKPGTQDKLTECGLEGKITDATNKMDLLFFWSTAPYQHFSSFGRSLHTTSMTRMVRREDCIPELSRLILHQVLPPPSKFGVLGSF